MNHSKLKLKILFLFFTLLLIIPLNDAFSEIELLTTNKVYSEGQPLFVYGNGMPNETLIIRLFAPDETIAKSLAIGDPGDGRYVLKRLAQYNGFAEECNNKEILDAILLLARTEGIFTEPAGGVSVAVLQKMVEQGKIDKNDSVVCYVTGNGLKATEAIMEVLPKPKIMKANITEISAVVN